MARLGISSIVMVEMGTEQTIHWYDNACMLKYFPWVGLINPFLSTTFMLKLHVGKILTTEYSLINAPGGVTFCPGWGEGN